MIHWEFLVKNDFQSTEECKNEKQNFSTTAVKLSVRIIITFS